MQRARAIPHRIQTLRFEFDGPDEASLLRQREQVDQACQRLLPELLEEVLDEVATDDEVLQIPRLEVDLGAMNSLELDLPAVAEALRHSLRNLRVQSTSSTSNPTCGETGDAPHNDETVSRRSLAGTRLEWFIGYLLYGDFGNVAPATRIADLVDSAQPPHTLLASVLEALGTAQPARRRGAIIRLLAVSPPAVRSALWQRLTEAAQVRGARIPDHVAADSPGGIDAVVSLLWPEEHFAAAPVDSNIERQLPDYRR